MRRQLWHGTPASLAAGDTLLPAAALGLPERILTPNSRRYSPLWVYLTERQDYAAVFGAVYLAQPIGPVVPDPDARQAWRCRRARIVERLT